VRILALYGANIFLPAATVVAGLFPGNPPKQQKEHNKNIRRFQEPGRKRDNHGREMEANCRLVIAARARFSSRFAFSRANTFCNSATTG
jgi:hypothetical protein